MTGHSLFCHSPMLSQCSIKLFTGKQIYDKQIVLIRRHKKHIIGIC